MLAEWYVTIDAVQSGPLTGPQLAEAARTGRLRPNDFVRKLDGPWVAASTVRGLYAPPSHSNAGAGSFVRLVALSFLALLIILASAAATSYLLRRDADDVTFAPASTVDARVDPQPPSGSGVEPLRRPATTAAAGATIAWSEQGSPPISSPPGAAIATLASAPPSQAPAPSNVAVSPAIATSPTAATSPMAAPSPAAAQDAGADSYGVADIVRQVGTFRRRLPSLVVGEDGLLLTFGNTYFRETDEITVEYSGTKSRLLGLVAALPGKNMVLLKSDAHFPKVAARFGLPPKVGDTVLAVHLAAGREPLTLATGRVAELLSGQTMSDAARLAGGPGMYDYDGQFFRIELTSIPPNNEYFFVNDAGEIIGLFARADQDRTEVFAVEATHLDDLLALKSDEVQPLTKLNRRTFSRGRVTLVDQLPSDSRVRPTPSATAGSRPVPAVVAAAPPIAVVAPLPAAPVVAEPQFDLDAPFHAEQWTAAMRRFMERRQTLVEENRATAAQIESLGVERRQRQEEYRQLEVQAAPLRQRFNYLQARLNDLNLVQQTPEVRNNIANYQAEQRSLNAQYDQLMTPAAGLEKRVAEIDSQLKTSQSKLVELQGQTKEARRAFLRLTHPFEAAPQRGTAAVAYFAESAKIDSEPAFAYAGRGVGHLLCERFTDAVADFDLALTLTPDESTFLALRGLAQLRGGELEKARADLARSASRDSKNPLTPLISAMLHCRTGAPAAAEAQLKEAQKLDPQDPTANCLLALMKVTSTDDSFRNAKFGQILVDAALKLAPQRWDALLAAAAVQAEQGNFKEAVAFAARAEAAAPKRKIEWCRGLTQSFRDGKPLRIDWKTFDIGRAL
ncbi:MAG: hypothetical protein JNL96_02085 [Planctomycetaceae bacterium]|nr:hypothetical protein [Planctomycetaceae bacterium]